MATFGTAKNAFQLSKLVELTSQNKSEEAKAYVNKYFIKIGYPLSVMMHQPNEKKFFIYKFSEVKQAFLKKSSQKNTFDICHWFFEVETTYYNREIDVHKPKIFIINKQPYVNVFPGFLHTEEKKFINFKKSIKDSVDVIWNHIYEVWTNKNQDLFDYIKSWICHVVNGKKMKTCLYLKSGEGTGKSVITEFLQLKVLGKNIVLTTSNPDCVVGQFNAQLQGKLLLILEEAPTSSASEWCSLTNSLKHLITDSSIEIHEKHQTPYTISNIVSTIINTNNNAIKISSDDRRFVTADISNCRVGDRAYFDKLHECTGNDEVAEAFYWYCKEYANKNSDFRENQIPVTNTKQELIIDNLHSVYDFIKETYLEKKQGLKGKYNEFYSEYEIYCNLKKRNKVGKNTVGKLLSNIGIDTKRGTANVVMLEITYERLLEIYQEKNWISDFDSIQKKPINKKPGRTSLPLAAKPRLCLPIKKPIKIIESDSESDEESDDDIDYDNIDYDGDIDIDTSQCLFDSDDSDVEEIIYLLNNAK
jgi:hypothetical protein